MKPTSFLYKTALAVAGFALFTFSVPQVGSQEGVNWRTYRQGALSNARTTQTFVFETEGQFQNYWQKFNETMSGKIPTGGIDWSREKLVAVNLGQRPNPGYEVVVRSIKRIRASEIQVLYQEQLPMPGVYYPQVMVSPWVIVKMERTAGVISFKGETVNRNTGVIGGPSRGDCCRPVCRCCANCTCCGEH
jgi:hypothetical protein